METHLKLKALMEEYVAEQDNFEIKCVKASAARARKALMEISKLFILCNINDTIYININISVNIVTLFTFTYGK